MPMIDDLGPGAECCACGCGNQRIISDLDDLVGMRADGRAELLGHHLRPKADAEKGLSFRERHADPVDLAPDEII